MTATPGRIVAALLLPPLGVYLRRGAGAEFWTAVALTLIAFVPGLIFALWSVLRPEPAVPA
ncbi:YqaE/Pmp3 family membrane protein [Sphingomonas sp.]|uniref:YqaE/Pmp3 family membrane protein n=1 Tax=Sphingomonas sp. TaxID=28214 RepID=UPI002DD69125|nr:YqaE/Pmp3 family membrane protein [Sphingomonas sp.]